MVKLNKIIMAVLCISVKQSYFTAFDLRQYRIINGYRLCCTLSLHIFRHLAQISLDRRQPAHTQFIQPDEKSDCAIVRQ